MNLEETIRHLKGSDAAEFKLVADFVDEVTDDEDIPSTCDLIIEAAELVKKAVTPPVLVISHDPYNDVNPRKDWDNFGTMVCWHDRYELGDEQPRCQPVDYFEDGEPLVKLPLYLYDHSGITMSTGPFSCPWDSGQVGWIFATADDVTREFGGVDDETRAKVVACLQAEVKIYDQYLRGAVWGYSYGDDSCCGFFGDELEETGMLDQIEAPRDVVEAAWEERT
jgi:hypothetical protein